MNKAILAVAAAVLGLALVITDVEARRLGGGRTMGAQRSVTNAPPAQTPARPGQQQTQQLAPGQRAAAPAAAPAGAAAAGQPAASGLSRWLPMLGGLALGGLLGAMFGSGGIAALLMVVLLAIVAFFAFRMLMRKRAEAPHSVQYAGLGSETVAAPPPSQAAGFDARPVAAVPLQSHLPAGFDAAGFLRGAKMNFMRMQIANDQVNLDDLREFTTSELFEELKKDVLERGNGKQQTDVVSLNADLLEVATEGDKHWASVRFSGMIREAPGAAAEGFEEVWNLVKPADGSTGWLLAGIQQMH
jgi:predicted lipid-binding transport protein (Tim44 family)